MPAVRRSPRRQPKHEAERSGAPHIKCEGAEEHGINADIKEEQMIDGIEQDAGVKQERTTKEDLSFKQDPEIKADPDIKEDPHIKDENADADAELTEDMKAGGELHTAQRVLILRISQLCNEAVAFNPDDVHYRFHIFPIKQAEFIEQHYGIPRLSALEVLRSEMPTRWNSREDLDNSLRLAFRSLIRGIRISLRGVYPRRVEGTSWEPKPIVVEERLAKEFRVIATNCIDYKRFIAIVKDAESGAKQIAIHAEPDFRKMRFDLLAGGSARIMKQGLQWIGGTVAGLLDFYEEDIIVEEEDEENRTFRLTEEATTAGKRRATLKRKTELSKEAYDAERRAKRRRASQERNRVQKAKWAAEREQGILPPYLRETRDYYGFD